MREVFPSRRVSVGQLIVLFVSVVASTRGFQCPSMLREGRPGQDEGLIEGGMARVVVMNPPEEAKIEKQKDMPWVLRYRDVEKGEEGGKEEAQDMTSYLIPFQVTLEEGTGGDGQTKPPDALLSMRVEKYRVEMVKTGQETHYVENLPVYLGGNGGPLDKKLTMKPWLESPNYTPPSSSSSSASSQETWTVSVSGSDLKFPVDVYTAQSTINLKVKVTLDGPGAYYKGTSHFLVTLRYVPPPATLFTHTGIHYLYVLDSYGPDMKSTDEPPSKDNWIRVKEMSLVRYSLPPVIGPPHSSLGAIRGAIRGAMVSTFGERGIPSHSWELHRAVERCGTSGCLVIIGPRPPPYLFTYRKHHLALTDRLEKLSKIKKPNDPVHVLKGIMDSNTLGANPSDYARYHGYEYIELIDLIPSNESSKTKASLIDSEDDSSSTSSDSENKDNDNPIDSNQKKKSEQWKKVMVNPLLSPLVAQVIYFSGQQGRQVHLRVDTGNVAYMMATNVKELSLSVNNTDVISIPKLELRKPEISSTKIGSKLMNVSSFTDKNTDNIFYFQRTGSDLFSLNTISYKNDPAIIPKDGILDVLPMGKLSRPRISPDSIMSRSGSMFQAKQKYDSDTRYFNLLTCAPSLYTEYNFNIASQQVSLNGDLSYVQYLACVFDSSPKKLDVMQQGYRVRLYGETHRVDWRLFVFDSSRMKFVYSTSKDDLLVNPARQPESIYHVTAGFHKEGMIVKQHLHSFGFGDSLSSLNEQIQCRYVRFQRRQLELWMLYLHFMYVKIGTVELPGAKEGDTNLIAFPERFRKFIVTGFGTQLYFSGTAKDTSNSAISNIKLDKVLELNKEMAMAKPGLLRQPLCQSYLLPSWKLPLKFWIDLQNYANSHAKNEKDSKSVSTKVSIQTKPRIDDATNDMVASYSLNYTGLDSLVGILLNKIHTTPDAGQSRPSYPTEHQIISRLTMTGIMEEVMKRLLSTEDIME